RAWPTDSDLRGLLGRLPREAPLVPVPHMAPGRPRRSADRRLRPPRGRPPEDGRVRDLPHQPRDPPRCHKEPVVGPRGARDGVDGVLALRLPRPGRSEALDRLQLDRAHGVRPLRGLEPHGDRRPRRNLPVVQPWKIPPWTPITVRLEAPKRTN